MNDEILIHKDLIGLDKNLIFNFKLNNFKLVSNIPKDIWTIEGKEVLTQNKNIKELCFLNKKNFSFNPPKKYLNVAKNLEINNCDNKIKWKDFLTNSDYKNWVNKLFQDGKNALENISHDKREYYENIFLKMKNPLVNLKKTKINKSLWLQYLKQEENSTQNSILKSFQPDKNGFAQIPLYDMVSSITGRLTVKNGPQILTLKKEYRNIISSRYGNDGKIVSLDFVSLEPRLALLFINKKPKRDVYNEISEKLFNNKISRSIVKSFVLSLLYGMSKKNLERKMENFSIEKECVKKSIEKIYDYFEIKKTIEKLVKELNEKGFIQSNMGRPIFVEKSISPYILLNYFIQSSSVEFSLLLFSNIIKYIKNFDLKIHPLFIIHDSLVLDCHISELNKIKDLEEIGCDGDEFFKKGVKIWMKKESII